MEINTQTSLHKLQERHAELEEIKDAPYLSEERKQSIRLELGRLTFELGYRDV